MRMASTVDQSSSSRKGRAAMPEKAGWTPASHTIVLPLYRMTQQDLPTCKNRPPSSQRGGERSKRKFRRAHLLSRAKQLHLHLIVEPRDAFWADLSHSHRVPRSLALRRRHRSRGGRGRRRRDERAYELDWRVESTALAVCELKQVQRACVVSSPGRRCGCDFLHGDCSLALACTRA